MLQLVDEALEGLLRAAVPLARGDVDVTFAAPDNGNGTPTVPTVNLLLWGVHRSSNRTAAGTEVIEIDGRPHRRAALPALDCHYVVSAWASDPRDEHNLLGAVLAAVLEHPEIPEEHLQGALASTPPVPTLTIAHDVPAQSGERLSAAGHPFKAAFELVATVTVDAALVRAAGPPVTRYEATVTDGSATSTRVRTAPGH